MNGDRGLKDRLWVPLSVDILEDEALNDCSIVAQLVYLRGLAHAKRASRDGMVSKRAVVGGLYSAVALPTDEGWVTNDDTLDLAIDELVRAELWASTDTDGQYQITGWLKHNEPVDRVAERIADRKAQRSANAHRTNHKKGLHDKHPHVDCPTCQEEFPQVGAHGDAERPQDDNGSGAQADHSPDRSAGALDIEQESEQEQEQEQQQQPRSSAPSGQAVETVTAVANCFGVDPLADGILGAIEIARARGWPDYAIVALAEAAVLRANYPRAWWAKRVETEQPPEPGLRTAEDFARFFAEHDGQAEDDAA